MEKDCIVIQKKDDLTMNIQYAYCNLILHRIYSSLLSLYLQETKIRNYFMKERYQVLKWQNITLKASWITWGYCGLLDGILMKGITKI